MSFYKPGVTLMNVGLDLSPFPISTSSKASALTDVGNGSKVFFALLLRLMYWFVGSSGDGIDDVDPTAGGSLACSF